MPADRWGYYDLSTQPPSHDFVTFCHYAKHFGANGIWFGRGFNRQSDYLGESGERERVESLLIPLCEKYGLDYKFDRSAREVMVATGSQDVGIVYPISEDPRWEYRHEDRFSHRFHLVKKLIAKPLPLMPSQEALDWADSRFGGRRPILVSIRNATYQKARNSSLDWHVWAEHHGARILPDYLDEKMSLDRTLACFELASLNIGVHQGRWLLNWFSARPYLIVKHIVNEYKVMNLDWVQKHQGMDEGDQMPWAGPHQKLLWNSEDDYQTIEREYQQYVHENWVFAGR